MEVSKKIFISAAFITAALLLVIYYFNFFLNTQRERVVTERMQEILDEYQEIQTLSLMSNVFGREKACISLESTLAHLDKTIWDAGIKIDRYRQVTEEFTKDPFYVRQKKNFNRNEVVYFSMLKEMKDWCLFNQTIVLYFYKKKEDCPKCDDQSFVLTDINKDIDAEIAIFSFDVDLGLPSVDTLQLFYNITSYPCIVVEESTYCGLYDKNNLLRILCSHKNLSVCP